MLVYSIHIQWFLLMKFICYKISYEYYNLLRYHESPYLFWFFKLWSEIHHSTIFQNLSSHNGCLSLELYQSLTCPISLKIQVPLTLLELPLHYLLWLPSGPWNIPPHYQERRSPTPFEQHSPGFPKLVPISSSSGSTSNRFYLQINW